MKKYKMKINERVWVNSRLQEVILTSSYLNIFTYLVDGIHISMLSSCMHIIECCCCFSNKDIVQLSSVLFGRLQIRWGFCLTLNDNNTNEERYIHMLLVRHMRTAAYLWLIAKEIHTSGVAFGSAAVVCAAEWLLDCGISAIEYCRPFALHVQSMGLG